MPSRRSHLAVVVSIVALLAVAIGGLVMRGPGTGDRAYELEQRLRCPVCKSVSIADSPSDTAEAMREVVAQQVAADRTDQQIIDFFRVRYGDWVLLDPPAEGPTLLLWLLPVVAVVVGGFVLFARRDRTPSPPITAAQRARVDEALARAREDLS
jgi:cytochrome c-type biogenesis protein CcmH